MLIAFLICIFLILQNFTEILKNISGDHPYVTFSDLGGCSQQIIHLPKDQQFGEFLSEIGKIQRY